MEKDIIRSINEFDPEKELLKNITTWLHLDRNMRLCTFSWHEIYCRQNRPKYCIVHNVGKLRSPLMLSAYKEGSQVPIRMYWILIKYIKVAFTVFFETVHAAHIFSLKEKNKFKKNSVHCSIVRYGEDWNFITLPKKSTAGRIYSSSKINRVFFWWMSVIVWETFASTLLRSTPDITGCNFRFL